MIAALADHLWQSSLFAAAAGLLTLTLRSNAARVRFWLWLAASVKFLLPFALLAALGKALSRLLPSFHALPLWTEASPRLLAMQPAAEPFQAPAHGLPADLLPWLLPALITIWALGFVLVLASRLTRGLRLAAVMRSARALPLTAPVTVKASAAPMEPGLVGVLRPVVLLPQGLLSRLSGMERDAILAHELCHLRRRDNLTALVHMLVEALFWFYPPVWLIGLRLMAERERACDEGVLAAGFDPGVYAGAILQVCRFCVRSPLACAPGVSGADLGRRIEAIMTGAAAERLGARKRLMLAGAAMLALGVPVAAGFLASPLAAPLAVRMQHEVRAARVHTERSLAEGAGVIARQIGIPTVPVVVKKLPRLVVVAAPHPASAPPPPEVLAAPRPDGPRLEQPPSAPHQAGVPAGPLRQAVLALYPSGAGDPEAVTCRAPQPLPASRLPGPEVCRSNRIWALLRAHGTDIGPDGKTLVARAGDSFQPGGESLCHVAALLGPALLRCF